FGRNGMEVPGFSSDSSKPRLPKVTQVAPPKPKVELGQGQEAAAKPEKLTFYDNLPKGNQAPLGSGINLPPESHSAAQTAAAASDEPLTVMPVTQPVAQKAVALPPQSMPKSAPTPVPVVDPGGAYVVQIASFRTTEDAGKLVHRLEDARLATFVERADLGEKGVWHRVLAGPFASREAADGVAVTLKEKQRLSALVRRR
ncbi:MAG: SPOR domain-containing protein, partial [Desulfuromonadales bacterium]|nr:SPOR domain-containing protein [Desulfuromonadales bacterium]